MKKSIVIFTIFLLICLYTTLCIAHSGKTDSSGGHYDSSTGEYHYHHGYPAHQHNEDGSCPYETDEEDSEEVVQLNLNDTTENATNEENRLSNVIDYKQQSIGKLNNEIDSKNNEINNLKFKRLQAHSIYILIIMALIGYITYLKNNKH